MEYPKWYTKVTFSVYMYRVYDFISNLFQSLSDKIATNPGFTNSSRSLFSFFVVHLPSNIIKAFYYNAPYE